MHDGRTVIHLVILAGVGNVVGGCELQTGTDCIVVVAEISDGLLQAGEQSNKRRMDRLWQEGEECRHHWILAIICIIKLSTRVPARLLRQCQTPGSMPSMKAIIMGYGLIGVAKVE